MSMIGKSLAHYSITAEIGKGGMGEVYQAKDTKHGREVAIKVLPQEFTQDADRVDTLIYMAFLSKDRKVCRDSGFNLLPEIIGLR